MIDLLQERGKKGSHGWLSFTIPQSSKEKITFLEPTSEWLIQSLCVYTCIYLRCGGNLFTASQMGHSEILEDRKRLTPSVFSKKETFHCSERNCLCLRYSHPSITSRIYSVSCFCSNLCCRWPQKVGSEIYSIQKC